VTADADAYTEATDCNDNNPGVNPGAAETCDGFDNNCDARVDEGCASCTDADHDGFFAQTGCLTAVDCNDTDDTIRPNAAELCNGRDDNCTGVADEGFDLTSNPAHCAACDHACSFVNAVSVCVDSVCQLGSCNSGFANCNTDAGDGCEINTWTNAENCGSCGMRACGDCTRRRSASPVRAACNAPRAIQTATRIPLTVARLTPTPTRQLRRLRQ